MKKILIPTDYSPNANLATLYGMRLATLFKSDVILVHGYHLSLTDPNFIPDNDRNEEIEKRIIQDKKEELTAVFPDIRIDARAIFGPVVDLLDKICDSEQIDLVVMGTKGQTNAFDSLTGTVASNVISEINSDVLVVPENATYDSIKEIVLASDYHHIDNYNCFSNLQKIINKTDASIAIVNIQKELNLFEIPSRTENRIEDLFSTTKMSKHFVQSDNLEESLDHFAKSHDADLIVLTSPHYTFWEKIWHRSLTKKMAFHSKIPLLILKE